MGELRVSTDVIEAWTAAAEKSAAAQATIASHLGSVAQSNGKVLEMLAEIKEDTRTTKIVLCSAVLVAVVAQVILQAIAR